MKQNIQFIWASNRKKNIKRVHNIPDSEQNKVSSSYSTEVFGLSILPDAAD
jgi:hypothetical protein